MELSRLAADGPAALAQLDQAVTGGDPFRLVLLDMMMPEMDGFEVAQRMRQNRRFDGCAIVMLSSAGKSENSVRCDELGNVWASSGEGAQIFSPTGDLIARILLPEGAANLAFGGPDGTTVYFTAGTSVYSIPSLVGDGAQR